METNRDNSDTEEEEEVTFLLRLRPTPSPPSRRRRHSVDCRPTPQTKENWDVIIQRKEVPSPILQRRNIPVQKRNASPSNFQRIDNAYPNNNQEQECDTSSSAIARKSITSLDNQSRIFNPSLPNFQRVEPSFPIVQRRDGSFIPTSQHPNQNMYSPVFQRRNAQSSFYQAIDTSTNPHQEQNYTPVSPPPLPPRILPSAPPLEEHDKLTLYPKQPPYFHCNRLSSEFSFSFPNLNHLDNAYGNLVPFSPRQDGVRDPFYFNHPYKSVVNVNGYSPTVGEFNGHYQNSAAEFNSAMSVQMRSLLSPVLNRPPKPTPRSSLTQGVVGAVQNRRESAREEEIIADRVSSGIV